jgi:hypothetical protein
MCPAARAAETARSDPTTDSRARDIADLPSLEENTSEAPLPFRGFAI